ncbi:hypothetical protein [Treponema sp. R80B11-R83G3]
MNEIVNDDFIPKIIDSTYKKCDSHWRLLKNFIDEYDITYIVKGSALYIINGKIHNLRVGSSILPRFIINSLQDKEL